MTREFRRGWSCLRSEIHPLKKVTAKIESDTSQPEEFRVSATKSARKKASIRVEEDDIKRTEMNNATMSGAAEKKKIEHNVERKRGVINSIFYIFY